MTRTAISPRLAIRTFWSTLGLSFDGRPITIARAVQCVPCGRVGTSAASTRSTRPTATCWSRPGRVRRPAWSRPPGTRRRAGAGSTGAGSPRRAPTCWFRSSCVPGASLRSSTCAPPPSPWLPPMRAGMSPRSTPGSSGPTTCWSTPPRWRGCWRRSISPAGRPRPPWSGWASTSAGPVHRERGARAWSNPADRRSIPRPCSTGSSRRWHRGWISSTKPPAGPTWPRSSAGVAPRSEPGVRVTLAAGEVTGTARAIDDAGQLVVDTPEGLRMVAAGDVVHLRAEPGGPVGRATSMSALCAYS